MINFPCDSTVILLCCNYDIPARGALTPPKDFKQNITILQTEGENNKYNKYKSSSSSPSKISGPEGINTTESPIDHVETQNFASPRDS